MIASGVTGSSDAWAVCGSTVEICGDGADNDCDGTADEGCGCLNTPVTAPYAFSSSTELRRLPMWAPANIKIKKGKLGVVDHYPYGSNMENHWTFAASHLASACRIGFAAFQTQPGDSLSFGGWTGSGQLAALGPSTGLDTVAVWSSWFSTTPEAPATWKTDNSLQNLGFVATQVECFCSNPPSSPNWVTLDPNSALDGALLFPKDDIYVRVDVPPDHDLYVNVDRMAAPGEAAADFNVMYTTSGQIPAPNDCGSVYAGCTTAPTGDMVGVPGQPWSQTVSIRVHAKSGKGRFRLFAAMPLARPEPNPNALFPTEVGVDRNVYGTNWEKPRIQGFLAQSSQQLLAATDGQFEPERYWLLDNDVWWFIPASSYDIWLTDNNDGCGNSTVAGCCWNCSTPWSGCIELNRWFWRGEVKAGNSEGSSTGRSVGEVLAHELGHLAFTLPDEYTTAQQVNTYMPAGSRRCSHSMMAGAGNVRYSYQRYTGDWNAFELCGPANHESNPVNTLSSFGDSSAWARAVAAYPTLLPPKFGSLFISNDFSQLRRTSELLESYTLFTWE